MNPTGWPLEIEVRRDDFGLPIIRAEKFSRDDYFLMPKSKKAMLQFAPLLVDESPPWLSPIDMRQGRPVWGDRPKKQYQWLGEKIGYNFNTAWNKIQFREWIAPHQELIYKLCFGLTDNNRVVKRVGRWEHPVGYNANLLKLFWFTKDSIVQAAEDNILNITPLLMHYNNPTVSPRMLKNFYGNGLWKKLCQQSLTRNKLLARFSVEDCEIAVDLPSTVLKFINPVLGYVPPAVVKEVARMKKARRLKDISEHDFRLWVYSVNDAERMAARENVEFNNQWGLARILRLHDELAEILNQRELQRWNNRRGGYQPTYGDFSKINGSGTLIGEKYDVIYLDTAEKIREEGREMHHCVGTYASEASVGNCSIYSIRDKSGKRVTTLQIYPEGRVGQHYGKFNAQPPEDVVELAKKVARENR